MMDLKRSTYQVAGVQVLDTMKDDMQVNIGLVNPGDASLKLYKGATVGHLESVTVTRESECLDDPAVSHVISESHVISASMGSKAGLDNIIQKPTSLIGSYLKKRREPQGADGVAAEAGTTLQRLVACSGRGFNKYNQSRAC